ncbi:hypothetical protein [Burkholderia gladioli]|jgi:hypothetical protein|uniref:hypothetical protein n=1 Tax=Burkholderia gladioli TaxID=28095 RepID=UPI000F547352|nr:hypothetical protein [Burkholderia gladioli]
MTKLSKEDVARIETELEFPFGCVVLRCGSDTVTIQVQRTKPRQYDLMVYVNGFLRWEYLKPGAAENRFYRPVSRPFYTPAKRAEIVKVFGKRRAAREFPRLYESCTYYMPSWRSTKPMLRHFEKTNETVMLVTVGVQIETSIDLEASRV